MDSHCVMCGEYLADASRMICEKCEKPKKAELKPCPFCGCEDIRVLKDKEAKYVERHRVICFNCSAQIYRGTPKQAIEAWNRRTGDGNG